MSPIGAAPCCCGCDTFCGIAPPDSGSELDTEYLMSFDFSSPHEECTSPCCQECPEFYDAMYQDTPVKDGEFNYDGFSGLPPCSSTSYKDCTISLRYKSGTISPGPVVYEAVSGYRGNFSPPSRFCDILTKTYRIFIWCTELESTISRNILIRGTAGPGETTVQYNNNCTGNAWGIPNLGSTGDCSCKVGQGVVPSTVLKVDLDERDQLHTNNALPTPCGMNDTEGAPDFDSPSLVSYQIDYTLISGGPHVDTLTFDSQTTTQTRYKNSSPSGASLGAIYLDFDYNFPPIVWIESLFAAPVGVATFVGSNFGGTGWAQHGTGNLLVNSHTRI